MWSTRRRSGSHDSEKEKANKDRDRDIEKNREENTHRTVIKEQHTSAYMPVVYPLPLPHGRGQRPVERLRVKIAKVVSIVRMHSI